jgi:branched-chain amino acid aminotransferase
MDLAAELGIACIEADIDLYDVYMADECFLTSTSLCICPVRMVNGMKVGGDDLFGPVTDRLVQAYREHAGCDFVGQYPGT